jgi:hypothetical protein
MGDEAGIALIHQLMDHIHKEISGLLEPWQYHDPDVFIQLESTAL